MYNFSSLFVELCSTLGSYLSHTWRYNRYMWGFCIWKYCSSVQQFSKFAHAYWQKKPNKANKIDSGFGWIFHGFDLIGSLSKWIAGFKFLLFPPSDSLFTYSLIFYFLCFPCSVLFPYLASFITTQFFPNFKCCLPQCCILGFLFCFDYSERPVLCLIFIHCLSE